MLPPTAALRFTLAAAIRMIYWVHRHSANVRTLAKQTGSSCRAARHVHVINITDLTDGRVTGVVNSADLA